mmetsp:Transcript_9054/g.21533  ORF Transcript_9054/g.21533 Transcript_9054/m.21533 type:complete len:213 (+) Transcript_9054:246-884(+)
MDCNCSRSRFSSSFCCLRLALKNESQDPFLRVVGLMFPRVIGLSESSNSSDLNSSDASLTSCSSSLFGLSLRTSGILFTFASTTLLALTILLRSARRWANLPRSESILFFNSSSLLRVSSSSVEILSTLAMTDSLKTCFSSCSALVNSSCKPPKFISADPIVEHVRKEIGGGIMSSSSSVMVSRLEFLFISLRRRFEEDEVSFRISPITPSI